MTTTKHWSGIVSIVAAIALALFVLPVFASAEVIYDSIPGDSVPGSDPSLGFQATQTNEFGDYIEFGGISRTLSSVDVLLNSWACQEGNWYDSTCAHPDPENDGYDHPITLTLYHVDGSGNPGSVIASVTEMVHVPWRPASDVECGTGYLPDCNNGFNFTASFDLSGVEVPNQVAYGISFNTQTYGPEPLGVDGPYNSLNMSVPDAVPTVGTDLDSDAVLWNTETVAWYSAPCPGNTFCKDTAWSGYVPAARFNAEDPTPVVNGGGHMLTEAAKRKDALDVSFGTEVYENPFGGFLGHLTVVLHNVGSHALNKGTFQGTDITELNLLPPSSDTCTAAMNMTVLGSWKGEEGYKAIFRAGESDDPASAGTDTVRVTLYKPDNSVLYDTHAPTPVGSAFPDESSCVGTARTGLDNGNVVINL